MIDQDFNSDAQVPSRPTNTGTPDKPINLPSHASGLPVWQSMDFSDIDVGRNIPMSADDMYAATPKTDKTFDSVQGKVLPSEGRYKTVFPGRDYEEMAAQNQDTLDKWVNGTVKAVGTASSAFVGGTLGLVYGAGKAIQSNKFSDLYDNEVNRQFDDINKQMENAMPNYYTHAEQDASWYSMPNIMTANFWSDKVIKNLGFSVGSMAGGAVWGSVLKNIAGINRLVRFGKGLELAQGVDTAIAGTTRLGRFGAVSEAIGSMSAKTLDQAGRLISSSERGVTSFMGSMGEASMEALQNLNSYRDKLISKYTETHGFAPQGADLEEINSHAEHVGNFTWGMNVALLTATNYMMLPRIMNSSRIAEKRAMNQIVKEGAEEGLEGIQKVMARVDASYVEKPFILERLAGKKFGGAFDKYIVKPGSLLFSRMEAFEEGMQYAIQTGTEDYFKRAQENGEDVSEFWDNFTGTMGNIFTHGVKEALTTKEGAESILIGGLSGGIQTSFSPFGENTYKERGLSGRAGTRGKNTEMAIQEIAKGGTLTNALKDAKKYFNIGINSQQLRQVAVASDNKLAEKNYERDIVQAYIMPRVKYGKLEGIKQELGLYRQQAMQEKGFGDLKAEGIALDNETKDQFLERLSKIESTAVELDKIFNTVNDKYSTIINKKGERAYNDEVVDKMTYAAGKILDYDTRLKELNNSLISKGVKTLPLEDAIRNTEGWKTNNLDSIVNDPAVQGKMQEAFTSIEEDRFVENEELKQDLADYASMLLERKNYVNEYTNIKNNPEEHKTEETTAPLAPGDQTLPPAGLAPGEEAPVTPKNTVVIKTIKGERHIKIGEEYFLGKVTDYDAQGNEVLRAPRLVVLGENADGTIKIKDNKGVRDVPREKFEDYKLASVKSTLENKKAKFMMDNWNTVWEHFGIKFRQDPRDINSPMVTAKGRLVYDEENDKDGILTFIYYDNKGRRKEVEVTRYMFAPKSDKYKHGMITEYGKLTAVQQQAKDEFIDSTDKRALEAIRKRMDILMGLYKKVSDRQTKARNLIESKKKQIEDYKKELDTLTTKIENQPQYDKRATRFVKFKSVTVRAIARATGVTTMIRQLEEEIEEQQNIVDDLDSHLDHIDNFMQNIEEQPINLEDFYTKLRYERLVLKDAIDQSKKALVTMHKVLRSAERLLEATLDHIRGMIAAFEKKYPGAPFNLAGFIEQNPNRKELYTTFRDELQSLEDSVALAEDDAEIPIQEKRIDDIKEHIDIADSELKDLLAQMEVHETIMAAFKERYMQYAQEKREEANSTRNEALKRELLGTNSKDVQNAPISKTYDPDSKKHWFNILAGTTSPSGKVFNKITGKWEDSKEVIAEHHKRANRFGYRMGTTIDPETIFGYVVTSETEKEALLPGLSEHLVLGKKIDPTDVVTLVVVRKNKDGEFELVDEFGEAIPNDAEDKLNKAIYQTFPAKDLPAASFRDDISEDQKEDLKKQYNLWRNTVKSKKELPDSPEPIKASFGLPQYVTHINPKGDVVKDYDARTTAEEAKFVTDETLRTTPVVHVVTTDQTYEHGTTGYVNALGRVFLEAQTGAVKLLNRTFNEREAINIYNSILQLAKNANEFGTLKSKDDLESPKIMEWLKSVVYWGIPKTPEKVRKDAGYNSIWFEMATNAQGKEYPALFISGLGGNFTFTPTNIENNRSAIISLLKAMYGNTSADLVNRKSYTRPYKELTGFDSKGKPTFRTWPNYQTFLLSENSPDSKGAMTVKRKKDEIPLVTNMKPVLHEGDVNREGIYFIRDDAGSFFDLKPQAVKKQATSGTVADVQKGTVNTSTPVTAVVATNVLPGKFDLDGKAPNVKPLKNPKTGESSGAVTFTLDGPKALEMMKSEDPNVLSDNKKRADFAEKLVETGVLKLVNASDAFITGLMMDWGMNPPTIKGVIHNSILREVSDQLTVSSIPVQPPISDPLDPNEPITDEAWKDFLDNLNVASDRLSAIAYKVKDGIKLSPREEAIRTAKSTEVEDLLKIMSKEVIAKPKPAVKAPSDIEEAAATGGPTGVTPLEGQYNFEDLIDDSGIPEDAFQDIEDIMAQGKAVATQDAEVKKAATDEEAPKDFFAALEEDEGITGEVADDEEPFRYELAKQAKQFEKEDWGEVEKWLAKVFPNIPVNRVKNVIRATNGRQVWGFYQRGAIYVYENAEVGTTYHEVFEAVWKAFAGPREKNRILREFRSRPGTFEYAFTGEVIAYKDATNQQIKETLAEEFRAKVLYGEDPVVYKGKNQGNLIKRMFDGLIDFIRTFFTGKSAISNTEKLFNKIGNGYYRDYNPFQYKLSLASTGIIDVEHATPGTDAEYRLANIPEVQAQELIQHMTFLTLDKMVKEDANLFAIDPESRSTLYGRIKKDILGDPEDKKNKPGILRNKINMYVKNKKEGLMTEAEAMAKINNMLELIKHVENEWDNLVKRHSVYLKTYDLTFDENDELNLNKEEETNKSFEQDARTVSTYRKSSPTVRLLLSSLPITEIAQVKSKDASGNDILEDKKVIKKTSVNGFALLPGDYVFNTLMNKLHDSVDIVDMLNRLSDIALQDPTYANLYEVLTKNPPRVKVKSLNTDKYKQSDLQLISAFWKSFKKQNADVVAVYIFPGGEVVIGDSSLASLSKQVKRQMYNAVVSNLRSKDNYVKYNPDTKKYSATDKIKDYPFGKEFKSYETLLNALGIDFSFAEYKALGDLQQKDFRTVVQGIKLSVSEINDFSSITTKSLKLEGRLLNLATLKTIATKKLSGAAEFENTYFNINGERSQSFIGVNALSNLYDVLSKTKNIRDLADTAYDFLLTDVFSKDKGSALLNKMFDIAGNGERTKGTEDFLSPVYIDGTIDEQSGKKKESSKLTYVQRLAQEINLNLNGYYLNLVPGDASIDWASKMYDKENPFVTEQGTEEKDYLGIFKNYFISEMDLARDDRNLFTKRDNKDLRFFKDILRDPDPNSKNPDALHNAIISDTRSPEDVYESKEFKDRIEKAIVDFIERDAKELEDALLSYGLVTYNEGGMTLSKLDFGIEEENISQKQLENKLNFITANYMIANVEYHKLLYSDPFQYKDELKRIKNFNSPRQALITGSPILSAAFSKTYNEGFEEGDDFYTDFSKDHFDTITSEDPLSHDEELGYEPFEDTDGGGNIIYKAYRLFRILAGDWSNACESQFRHDVGYEKLAKSGASQEDLDNYEKNNPGVSDAYRTLKPIVAGSKDSNRGYNDIVMDKYALVPHSFRILHRLNPNSNAIKQYNKMQRGKIDYNVFNTGRKVGAELLSPLYNEDGSFNETPYRNAEQEDNPALPQTVIKVPHTIMSVQAEVPTKAVAKTTEGSQITQLATLDYMQAGMPIDYNPEIAGADEMSADALFNEQLKLWEGLTEDEKQNYPTKHPNLYKEITNNRKLLEVRILQGYEKLLRKVGIKETPDGYEISDREKLIDTLTDEILKREVNENILEAFEGVKQDKVVMEATPAYKQIRNILFSMANQAVVTKKISGKMAVQIPERLLESGKIKVEEVNGKKVYNSNNLKFYKDADGKRVCEIMVGRWFNSDKTDEELLKFLNTTDEGKRILEGVGFRIPTQKQNSIDSFVIKQFLPKEFGDNVVIPAALVKKVGSDFDIDKLSMYFKNVKVGKDGYPQLVKMKDDTNSTVEGRYIDYVGNNSKKIKDFVEDLRDKVGYTEAKGVISQARKEIKEDSEYYDSLSLDGESIYQRGYELFSKLPKAIKQLYWDQNAEFFTAGVEGIEKIMQQSLMAETIIEDLHKNPNKTYVEKNKIKDGPLVETHVKVNAKEVSDVLHDMIENYDEVLVQNGFTAAIIDNIKAKKLRIEGMKDLMSNQLRLNLASAIAEVSDLETLDDFGNRPIEMQNTREAIDNAYQQSLFNLVSHPLNFERLVVPNSAQPLIDLNDEIGRLTNRPKTDYSAVGNMLKRSFMSKLRHAFVTGKQAIGIAAIAQTNNSQNQRSPMVVYDEKLAQMPKKERYWLGDAKIKFSQYNSLYHDGKIRPTLSKIKNKAGEYISDIVGMFIDGYVDIAKGPWIMELGATPNTAGTWLFLIKLGVPVNTVAYFMNQPIIKEYLKQVESAGYVYLFIDTFEKEIKKDYASGMGISIDVIPSNTELKEMLGKNLGTLSPQQRDNQVFILGEFLKYAKMSEHLFFVTQGSNYNTATFSDPFLLLQKEYQLDKARRTIFSSVDNILDNSFIGILKNKLENIRDAYSELLISDKKTKPEGPTGTRDVLTQVLEPFFDSPTKEFLKISQKAVTDLFDWVIQTSGEKKRNQYIMDILVGDRAKGKRSASEQVMDYKKSVMDNPEHPLHNNIVLKNFNIQKGAREGKIDALYIAGKDNKVYEQNLLINSFRELKEQLQAEKSDLYTKIVGLTILQSGLSTSPVSFTHLLPYEDFINTYNEILSRMDENPSLQKFADLRVFERVNWNNTDVVPFKRFSLKQSKKNPKKWFNPNLSFRDKRLTTATSNGILPMMLNISEYGQEGNYDVISYSWEPQDITKTQKAQMRRAGDYSYIKKGLFQKVYTTDVNGNPTPLIQVANYNGQEYRNYVYKAINAWGDSFKAREMYDTNRISILDNDYMKVVGVLDKATGRQKIIMTSDLTPEQIISGYDAVTGDQYISGEVDDAVVVEIMGGAPEIVVPLEEEQEIDKRVTNIINTLKDNDVIDKNCE